MVAPLTNPMEIATSGQRELPVKEPQKKCQRNADQNRCGDWNIDAKILSPEGKIARQAPESDLLEKGPKQANCDQYDAERNEQPTHFHQM